MSMFSLFRLLLLLGCFSVASSASAVDYYWTISYPPGGTHYTSASSACQANTDYYLSIHPGYTLKSRNYYSAYNGTAFVCAAQLQNADQQIKNIGNTAQRVGDTCPSGSVYNSATGNCDVSAPDPCEEKAGQTQNFFANTPPGQSSLPGEYVCINSCRAAWSGECGANDAGVSACWGLATFTGAQCQSGDTPGGPPPSTEDPDAPTCPDGYSWSGTTCVPTTPEEPCEGEHCPEEPCEGEDCPEEPCEGEDCPEEPCEGEDCPEEPCEGEDCPDDGDNGGDDGGDSGGDTGTDPDGNPCNPLTDPNCTPCNPATNPSCASSVAGLDDCSTDLTCKGDAIQCAILRTQKKQLCQTQWNAQVEAQVSAAVSGPQFELEEKTIPVANLFNEAVSKGRWLNSTCPPPKNIAVAGKNIQLSFEPVCDFASALGPLIVAMASISFALIIGKGLKGN